MSEFTLESCKNFQRITYTSAVFTFDHYQFTEVILKCFSCLVSAENTCTFNNNKLFKKFKEKLAVTPGAITCIPA